MIFGTGRTNSVRPIAKWKLSAQKILTSEVEESCRSKVGSAAFFQLFSGIRMFQNVYGSVWRKLCYFTNKEACKRSLQLSNCRSDSNPRYIPGTNRSGNPNGARLTNRADNYFPVIFRKRLAQSWKNLRIAYFRVEWVSGGKSVPKKNLPRASLWQPAR